MANLGVWVEKIKKGKSTQRLAVERRSKLVEDLDNFDNGFFTALAGTDKYEIVPTITDDGNVLSKEQYALVKTECSRLGLRVLYYFELNTGTSIFLNPENMRVGYVQEGMH